MAVINPFDFFVERRAETYPFTYEPSWREDLAPYLEAASRRAALPALRRADRRASRTRRPSTSWSTLNQRLQSDIRYVIRMEPGVQTPEETLALRCGSCRDTAGCWCRCCAISASPRASSRAT